MDYVILPDGSAFPITRPEDYQEAVQIAHDELGHPEVEDE